MTAEGKTQLPPSAAETIRERVLKHLAWQLPGRACHFPEQTRPSEAKDAALIVQARGSGFILSLFSRSSRQPFLLREPSPLLLQPPTPGQGHSPGTFSSTRKGPTSIGLLQGTTVPRTCGHGRPEGQKESGQNIKSGCCILMDLPSGGW